MSDPPRPKPSLRVDTRTRYVSDMQARSPPLQDVINQSINQTVNESNQIHYSVCADGEIIDQFGTTMLRRGRLLITRVNEPNEQFSQSNESISSVAESEQPISQSTNPTSIQSNMKKWSQTTAMRPRTLKRNSSHTIRQLSTDQSINRASGITFVSEVDVLIKSFIQKRPTNEEMQRMRYDFEVFQNVEFCEPDEKKPGQQSNSQTNDAHKRLSIDLSKATIHQSINQRSLASVSSLLFIKPLHLLHDERHGLLLIYRDSSGQKLSSFIGSFISRSHSNNQSNNQSLNASPEPPMSLTPLQSVNGLISFVKCALALTDLLSILHTSGVVYRALRPSTTLYDPIHQTAQFVDFSQCSLLNRERQPSDRLAFPENSLPYLAPEATGRMNRLIDTRSDLYSLGCTLMELLTGRPPFTSTDVMELVHCHLARTPPSILPLAELMVSHPVLIIINDIIQKLLAKPAEDRYQTAFGLRADLMYCLQRLHDEQKKIENSAGMSVITARALQLTQMSSQAAADDFKIGQMDLNSTFRLSQKLYGRSREVKVLLTAFDRVCLSGRVEMVLVRGYSGSGKTHLCDELLKPIVRQKGLIIRGKFDLFKRNLMCVLEAFSSFIVSLLADEGSHLETWRNDLIAALGFNAAVIVDVIPELEQIIGPQPAVAKLPGEESQYRFNRTFLAFFNVFARRNHPVVLYIDDLQWCDSNSLSLIKLLFQQEQSYCLLICAYRSNEVPPGHPFLQVVDECRVYSKNMAQVIEQERRNYPLVQDILLLDPKDEALSQPDDTLTLHTITVGPLQLQDITDLVMDSFHQTREQSEPLAQLLMQRTAANPFFISMMLSAFHQDGLLSFSFSTGRWEWVLEALRMTKSGTTSDVIDLLCTQIKRFSDSQVSILCWAACLGNTFTLSALASVAGISVENLAAELWSIIKTGLLLPIGPSFEIFLLAVDATSIADEERWHPSDSAIKTPNSEVSPNMISTNSGIWVRFLHDRVQQAAYQLIAPQDRRVNHVLIGRALLASTPPASLEAACLDIVEQLNHAVPDLIADAEECRALINLDLIAGKRGKHNLAYDQAVKFLEVARTLCSVLYSLAPLNEMSKGMSKEEVMELAWKHDYDLVSTVYRELAESVFLSNDYVLANVLLETALEHTVEPLDRALVKEMQMQAFIQQREMRAALDCGLSALDDLGIELVPEILLGEPDDEKPPIWNEDVLSGDKEMSSPTSIAGMRVLCSLCAPTYVLSPTTFARVACTMVRLSCDEGPTSLTSVGLGLYTILLNGFKRLKSGFLVGQWSLKILNRFPSTIKLHTAKVYGCFYAHCWQWHMKLRDAVGPLTEAVMIGVEAGDLEWSGYDTFYLADTLYFAGETLDAVARHQQDAFDALCKRKQLLQSTYLNIWRRHVLKMLLQAPVEYMFHGKITTDDEILASLEAAQNHMFLFTHYLAVMMSCFYERKHNEAVAMGAQAATHAGGVVGMITNAHQSLYYTLSLLNSIPLASTHWYRAFPRPPTAAGTIDFLSALIPATSTTSSDPMSAYGTLSSPTTPARARSSRSPGLTESEYPYLINPAYPVEEAERILAQVDEEMKTMSRWAEHNAANFLAFFLLMEAERARVICHLRQQPQLGPYIVQHYDAAIAAARANGLIQIEALAAEMAAYYFMSVQRVNESRTYLKDAYFNYGRWGCIQKLHSLAINYPFLLKKQVSVGSRVSTPAELASASSVLSQSSGSSSSSDSQRLSPNTSRLAMGTPAQEAQGLIPRRMTASTHASSPAMLSHNMSAAASPHTTNPATPELSSLVLLRACTAFSVETNFRKLLRRIMLLLLQHANASKGYLLLRNEDDAGNSEWTIEIEASCDDDENGPREVFDDFSSSDVSSHNSLENAPARRIDSEDLLVSNSQQLGARNVSEASNIPLTGGISINEQPDGRAVADCLPLSVFNLVVSTHSMQLLTVDDLSPASNSVFSRDPYFAVNHPKSVLCAPIKQQSKLSAVLYLENELLPDAFSTSQLQLLELITVQAALSINNARLYGKLKNANSLLERTVAERTSQLEEKNTALEVEILERKTAQEATLKAKEDAEAATRSKSAFLSNMSHEIRTPLNAVLGITRLMQDTPLTSEQAHYLSMVTSSGELLLSIINDILDWSKIDSQKLELETINFSLTDCVESSLFLIDELASKKALDLCYLVDPACPSTIMADSTRLQQIILNLLSNATKFTSVGEVVLTVTAKPLGLVWSHDVPASGSPHHSALEQPVVADLASSEAGLTTSPLSHPRVLSRMRDSQSSSPVVIGRSIQTPLVNPSSRASPKESPLSPRSSLMARSPLVPLRSISPIMRTSTVAFSPSFSSRSIIQSNASSRSNSPQLLSPRSASPTPFSVTTQANASMPAPASSTPLMRYRLFFAIRDTGIGISASTQDKLFKSFTQANSSTTRKFGGTGLGLAISKRLAEAMGGEMWVESAEGSGATFFFAINVLSTELNTFTSKVFEFPIETTFKEHWNVGAVELIPRPVSTDLSFVQHRSNAIKPSMRASPGERSPVDCAGSPAHPSNQPVAHSLLHALSEEEAAMLKNMTVLVVCDRVSSLRQHVLLMISYGARVCVATDITSALATIDAVRAHHQIGAVTRIKTGLEVDHLHAPPAAHLSPLLQRQQDVSKLLAALTKPESKSKSRRQSIIHSDVSATTSQTTVDYFKLVLFDTTVPVAQKDSHTAALESALSQQNRASVICIVGTRRREDRSDYQPNSARKPDDESDRDLEKGNSSSPEGDIPSIKQSTRSLAADIHNLNLSDLSPAPENRPSSADTNLPSSSSPVRVSPDSFSITQSLASLGSYAQSRTTFLGTAPVEVCTVMKPIKQRDMLYAIISVLERLSEDTFEPNSAPGQTAQPLSPLVRIPSPLPFQPQSTLATPSNAPVASRSQSAQSARRGTSNEARTVPNAIQSMAINCPMTILVAEDNKTNQKLMSMLLAKMGYTVTIAENGLEALEHLERGAGPQPVPVDGETPLTTGPSSPNYVPYSLILMDVHMPELDGLEAARICRSREPRYHSPYIIALTANATLDDQKRCLECGMDSFLSKPISVPLLAAAIKKAYEHKKGTNNRKLTPSSSQTTSQANISNEPPRLTEAKSLPM